MSLLLRIIVFSILTITAIVIIMMAQIDTISESDKLEKWINTIDIITQIAFVVTVVAGIVAFNLKGRLAEIQKEQLAKFDVGIAEAKKVAAEADAKIATANLAMEEAITKGKEIEQENLKLRLELNRLDLATRARILSTDKINIARKTLEKMAGNSVKILYLSNDAEGSQLADSLEHLFVSAKWKTEKRVALIQPTPQGIDVIIRNTDDHNLVVIGNVILKALTELGFKPKFLHDPKLSDVIVRVGAKEIRTK